MELLTVPAGFHRIHHDVLRSHKGQFRHQMFLNDLGIHHQAVHHIQVQVQNSVDGQKALGDGQALVGGIVQGAFKPLGRSHHHGIHHIAHDVIAQGSNPLAAHGIALVGHGGRTNLMLLKRLLHLFQMLQQADIVGKLVGALGNTCQYGNHAAVDLSGVGLARYGVAAGKAHLFRNPLIQSAAFLMISVKKFQEAGLGTRCSFRT